MMQFQRAQRPRTVTVVFTDWDDQVIGQLEVPREGDARPLINEYVKTHFIHPQLREGVDHNSLDRLMTYRGRYPADGPGGTLTVEDGGRYPNTDKLDYVLLKGLCHFEGDKLVIEDAPKDDPYPYTRAWAVVKDRQDPPWTTCGVGELEDYEHRKGGGA